MEKPCLNDKNEYPDNEVLSSHLGEAKSAWDSLMGMLKQDYPAFSGEWRYYNDGKSWLHKLTKKKKTISWISVWPGMFKTTFYFPDRAEELILASSLAQEYKDKFVHGKRYGKTRGLTVEIKNPADLDTTKTLIDIKEKIK